MTKKDWPAEVRGLPVIPPRGRQLNKYDFFYSFKRTDHQVVTIGAATFKRAVEKFLASEWPRVRATYPALSGFWVKCYNHNVHPTRRTVVRRPMEVYRQGINPHI